MVEHGGNWWNMVEHALLSREDGQTMHFEAFGHADLAAGQMMRLETLFRLYSQTRLGRSEKRREHFSVSATESTGPRCEPWITLALYDPSRVVRKPFLVVGFLILYERGIVDLHDPISKFLPEFEASVVGAKRCCGAVLCCAIGSGLCD